MRGAAIGLTVALAACLPAPPVTAPVEPKRIVSLDYCADQYVLKLVPRARIRAVSPDAAAEFSYMRTAAAGVPQVRPSAEDVLLLKPDLVVRSYGGGPNVAALLARAGVPVLQLGYADDLPGVRRVLIDAAAGLGERAKGEGLAREFDAKVAGAGKASGQSALYVTPGGVTSGAGDAGRRTAARGGAAQFPGGAWVGAAAARAACLSPARWSSPPLSSIRAGTAPIRGVRRGIRWWRDRSKAGRPPNCPARGRRAVGGSSPMRSTRWRRRRGEGARSDPGAAVRGDIGRGVPAGIGTVAPGGACLPRWPVAESRATPWSSG